MLGCGFLKNAITEDTISGMKNKMAMKAIKKIVAKYNDINLIFRIFIGM